MPHEFRQAVEIARDLTRSTKRLEITDVNASTKIPGALEIHFRHQGAWDSATISRYEEGTAEQTNAEENVCFRGDICGIDAVAGTIVVLVKERSPNQLPDEKRPLVLKPVDYLSALDEFAQTAVGNEFEKRTDVFSRLPQSIHDDSQDEDSGAVLGAESLRPAQQEALRKALRRDLSFIWGPPGTGKSYTLGTIVANLRERGESVLLLSTTNVAVDVATFAADDACKRIGKPLQPRELVRYAGTLSNLEEFEKRPHLCSYTDILKKYDNLQKNLDKQIADVSREIRRRRTGKTFELRAEKGRLQNEKKDLAKKRKEELNALKTTARILAVTFTAAIFSKILELRRFDAIVVDEASQIPLAAWVYLTYRHKLDERFPRIIVAGDPLQLQPIPPPLPQNPLPLIRRSVESWFGRSIYSYVGLNSPEDAFPRVTFLNEQSRMREAICEAVSRTFYSGRLQGTAAPKAGDEKLPALLLLQAAPPTRIREGNNISASTCEAVHAYVQSLIERLDGSPLSIRVLSAFKNQRRQLEVQLFARPYPKNVSLQVSTVHTSQGSEADVVLIDVSDVPAHRFVSEDAGAKNMWCVAVSRAKRQCVLVLSDPEQAKRDNEYIRALFRNAKVSNIR